MEKEEDAKAKEEKKGPEKMILIAGLGGLGTVVATYLARAGIPLVLADPDCVEEKNLYRQVLYSEEDVGRRKVEVAAKKLRAFSKVIPFPYPAQEYEGQISVVVDCVDTWEEKRVLWKKYLGKVPVVFGTVGEECGCVGVFLRKYPEKRFVREPRWVPGPLPGVIGSLMAYLSMKLWNGECTGLEDKLLCMNFQTWETIVLRL